MACKISKYEFAVYALLSCIIFVFSYYTPYQLDDFLPQYYLDNNPDGTLWSALCTSYINENGRLANLLLFGIPFVPKWLYSFTVVIICITGVSVSTKLINYNGQYSWAFPAFVAAVYALLMPWNHRINIISYTYNTVLPAVVWLYVISLYSQERKCVRASEIFIVFIAATLHEGFSAVMVSGLMLSTVLSYKRVDVRRCSALILAMSVGSLFPLLSPGFIGRFGNGSYTAVSNGPMFKVLFIVLFLTSVYSVWFKKKIYRNLWNIFQIRCVICCLIVGIVAYYTVFQRIERSAWMADTLSVIIMLVLCQKIKLGRQVRKIMAGIIIISAIVALSLDMPSLLKVYQQDQMIYQRYESSDTGTVPMPDNKTDMYCPIKYVYTGAWETPTQLFLLSRLNKYSQKPIIPVNEKILSLSYDSNEAVICEIDNKEYAILPDQTLYFISASGDTIPANVGYISPSAQTTNPEFGGKFSMRFLDKYRHSHILIKL